MKNRDKYNTMSEFKAAFDEYCHNQSYGCSRRGFGRSAPVVHCSMCFQMWLNCDAEAEQKEFDEKMAKAEEKDKARQEEFCAFVRKYPGLAPFDADEYLKDNTSLNELNTPCRAVTCLMNGGIKTVKALLDATPERLKSLKGCGKTSLAQILEAKDSIIRFRKDKAEESKQG